MNYNSQAFDAAIEPDFNNLLPNEGFNVFDSVRDSVYEPRAWDTATELVRTQSYSVNMALTRDDWYVWRNGIKAPCYCNCRHLNTHPAVRIQITDALSESVRRFFPNATLIAGMATAGISWARSVADNLGLPLAYIRSTAKKHGVGGLVECVPTPAPKLCL